MLPDLASDVIDVVLLLVTELVTNAVVHAQTSVRVCVEISGSRVRIDVQDEATTMPGRRPVSVDPSAAVGYC